MIVHEYAQIMDDEIMHVHVDVCLDMYSKPIIYFIKRVITYYIGKYS